jgi:hypothetical protein
MKSHEFTHPTSLKGRFSRSEQWYLLTITFVGAIIRCAYLRDRPFVGDEVGTLIYIGKDIPYLLSHFTTWLTMNYFIVTEKLVADVFGRSQLSLGFISLVAGIATVPLTAFLARRFASSRVSLIAAALVSVNPYLVSYSAIIRSYSLLAALSLIVMILFFKWYGERTYRNGTLVGIGSYLLILTHPNGLYVVIYIFSVACAGFVLTGERREYFTGLTTVLLPLSVSALLVYLSYSRIFPEMMRFGASWHDTPPTSVSYVPYIFTQYFSGGFFAWVSAASFIAGALVSYKYEKSILVLLPAVFLPMLLMAVQGSSTFPWAYARFLIFIVPIIIIFMAEGIDHYAKKLAPEGSWLPAVTLVILLILSWTPQIKQIFDRKSSYPWHEVAYYITKHFTGGDIIVGSSRREPFNLLPYFSERPYPNVVLSGEALLHSAFGINSMVKIFFVASGHVVETAYPSVSFGKIQVITYKGSPGQQAARTIRNDLVNTVGKGGALDPELTSFYRNIWDINNYLGEQQNNFYYYNLWIKCRELTERQRNIPYRLQISKARRFVADLPHGKDP